MISIPRTMRGDSPRTKMKLPVAPGAVSLPQDGRLWRTQTRRYVSTQTVNMIKIYDLECVIFTDHYCSTYDHSILKLAYDTLFESQCFKQNIPKRPRTQMRRFSTTEANTLGRTSSVFFQKGYRRWDMVATPELLFCSSQISTSCLNRCLYWRNLMKKDEHLFKYWQQVHSMHIAHGISAPPRV